MNADGVGREPERAQARHRRRRVRNRRVHRPCVLLDATAHGSHKNVRDGEGGRGASSRAPNHQPRARRGFVAPPCGYGRRKVTELLLRVGLDAQAVPSTSSHDVDSAAPAARTAARSDDAGTGVPGSLRPSSRTAPIVIQTRMPSPKLLSAQVSGRRDQLLWEGTGRPGGVVAEVNLRQYALPARVARESDPIAASANPCRSVLTWLPSMSSQSFERCEAARARPVRPVCGEFRRLGCAGVGAAVWAGLVWSTAHAVLWWGGVGSVPSPGSDWSEVPTVGVGSAALDVVVAPVCPPGLAFLASATSCRYTTSDSRLFRARNASIGVLPAARRRRKYARPRCRGGSGRWP